MATPQTNLFNPEVMGALTLKDAPDKLDVDNPTGNIFAIPELSEALQGFADSGLPGSFEKREETSSLDYILNQAKLGIGDTFALLNASLHAIFVDPFTKGIPSLLGFGGDEPLQSFVTRWGSHLNRDVNTIASLTGAQTSGDIVDPPSLTAQVLGGGARMITDPAGYIGIPLKTINTLGGVLSQTVPQVLSRTATLGGAGVVAETTGEVGAQVEEAITGEDTGIGRFTGSLLGAGSYVPVHAATKTAVQKSFGWAKDPVVAFTKRVHNKYKGMPEDTSELALTYNNRAANKLLESIVKTQEGKGDLEEVIQDFATVSKRLNSVNKQKIIDTKDVPLFVALSDNPKVASEVQRLAKQDPEFRAAIQGEMLTLSNKIDTYATHIFGERNMPIASPAAIEKQFGPQKQAKYAELQAKIAPLNAKIRDKMREAVPPGGEVARGKAIENLVEARKQSLFKIFQPVYREIDKSYGNAVIPTDVRNGIFTYIRNNRIKNVFARTPDIENKVLGVFSPKAKTPATFKNWTSLKKAVNKRLRELPPASEQAIALRDFNMYLNTIKKAAYETVSNIPNARFVPTDAFRFYKGVVDFDKVGHGYYQRLGLPMNEQGILEITSKKYASQISPVLLKNEESLEDFLNATDSSPEALEVVKKTVFADVAEASMKDGLRFDGKAFDKRVFQLQQKNIFEKINDPAFEEGLQRYKTDQGSLAIDLKQLNAGYEEAQERLASNFLIDYKYRRTGEILDETLPSAVLWEDVFTGPRGWLKGGQENLRKGLSDIEAIAGAGSETALAVRKSMRRAYINKFIPERLEEYTGNAFQYLVDSKNAPTVRAIMGKTYAQDLKKVAKLADKLHRADADRLGYVAKPETEIEIPVPGMERGVDLPYAVSTARNPIASKTYKITRLISKLWSANRGAEIDRVVREVLLDADGIKKLSLVADKYKPYTAEDLANKSKKIGQEVYKDFAHNIGIITPLYLYGASKGVLFRETREEPKQDRPRSSF